MSSCVWILRVDAGSWIVGLGASRVKSSPLMPSLSMESTSFSRRSNRLIPKPAEGQWCHLGMKGWTDRFLGVVSRGPRLRKRRIRIRARTCLWLAMCPCPSRVWLLLLWHCPKNICTCQQASLAVQFRFLMPIEYSCLSLLVWE